MTTPDALLGCWQLAGSADGIDSGERKEMQLESSGQMIYGILADGRWQIMLLSFQVEGDVIVSNQDSAHSEERTRYSFLAPDTL